MWWIASMRMTASLSHGSFDSVVAGQLIGQRHDGRAVAAPADGFVVFPNPGALPGNEWFYFAQKSARDIG